MQPRRPDLDPHVVGAFAVAVVCTVYPWIAPYLLPLLALAVACTVEFYMENNR